jgi:hypothetical protein
MFPKWVVCFLLFIPCYGFSKEASVAVLIHGCHLETKNWEAIVFGDELHEGRATSGIAESLQQKAAFIIWGSGASEKEGMKESEYTFARTLGTHLEPLARYFGLPPGELSDYLKSKSLLQLEEKNTADEIRSALALCRDRQIEKLVLISSPTHIARCLQESCKLKMQEPYRNIRIYARASDVCFEKTTPHDVLIIEPPHRTDRPQLPLHHLFRQLFHRLNGPEGSLLYADLIDWLEQDLSKSPPFLFSLQ